MAMWAMLPQIFAMPWAAYEHLDNNGGWGRTATYLRNNNNNQVEENNPQEQQEMTFVFTSEMTFHEVISVLDRDFTEWLARKGVLGLMKNMDSLARIRTLAIFMVIFDEDPQRDANELRNMIA
jgi:hypothetical protein